MRTVIYIHGFAGSGHGVKAEIFRRHYREKGVPFLAPSLPYIPDLAADTLEEIVACCGDVGVVGSSLGGFYAARLAKRLGIPAVLINPAMRMSPALSSLEGFQTHYYDLSRFEWTPQHKASLRRMNEELGENLSDLDVLLLLKTGDEVLDYRDALHRFDGLPPERIVVEEGGDHSFADIETGLPMIDAFFGRFRKNRPAAG